MDGKVSTAWTWNRRTVGKTFMALSAGPALIAVLFWLFVDDTTKYAAWAPSFMGVRPPYVPVVFGLIAAVLLVAGAMIKSTSSKSTEVK